MAACLLLRRPDEALGRALLRPWALKNGRKSAWVLVRETADEALSLSESA